MADLSNLVAVLQRKIKEREAKIRSLEEQIQAPRKQGGKQGGETAGDTLGTGDHATYQQKISELNSEIQHLQAALASEKAKLWGDRRVTQLETTVKELEVAIQTKESEITLLKGNAPPTIDRSELKKLETELESLSNMNTQLHADLESSTTQKSKMQVTVEELQSQILVKNQLHQTLQEEVRTLKDQLANIESKLIEINKVPMEAPVADPQISAEGEATKEGATELPPEELSSIDTTRWVCPKCGNNHRHMIREEEDKSIILNVAPRVYGKKLLCGLCGWKWHHQ